MLTKHPALKGKTLEAFKTKNINRKNRNNYLKLPIHQIVVLRPSVQIYINIFMTTYIDKAKRLYTGEELILQAVKKFNMNF